MKVFILLTLVSLSLWASPDGDKRPKPFPFMEGEAVFVDFLKADYKITYDFYTRKAEAVAEIEFESFEDGYPIFDSIVTPTSVSLNGVNTWADAVKTPDEITTVRVISTLTRPGIHKLKVILPVTDMVSFAEDGVRHAFWMGDLEDRMYLERYLPTNLLFDRIPMTLRLKYIGMPNIQSIYTNGKLTTLSSTEVLITFPEGYNASCPYLHTMPVRDVLENRFIFDSSDGRKLPVVIYDNKIRTTPEILERLKLKTISILNELEKDYGPFLHDSLTIYMTAKGGMEYSGATTTSEAALGHELFHSYFARGVLPSDGNSGWIDEALASWRDNGYKSLDILLGTSNIANHEYYNRTTDRLAYTFGERFMAFLNAKLKDKGGLKPFLRELVETKAFDPISVSEFTSAINAFFDENLDLYFQRYVFGKISTPIVPFAPLNHIHHQFTHKELKKLL